jgi:hypothetical protein
VKRLIKLREIYVVWKQRAVVFWKPSGNTEVTTACRLRRHKIQRQSTVLQAPNVVCCEHIKRLPYFPFLALQFSYFSLSQKVHAFALDF